jgi:hypothetical protein
VHLATRSLATWALLATALATAARANPPAAEMAISAASFKCVRDMHPVRGFYVDNLLGDAAATIAVASSPTGGVYPPGSVVQLVPGEVMVKREAGFNPATKDWEFFELDVSPQGTTIRARGFAEVVNRFGGNCFACHVAARPEWDMICEKDHGCAPIPLTTPMIVAIQKTDPRCAPVDLTDEDKQALVALQAALAPPATPTPDPAAPAGAGRK